MSGATVLGALGIVVILAGWEVLTLLGVAGTLSFPSPAQTASALSEQILTGQIFPDLASSGVLFITALLAAAALGIPAGFAAGSSATLRGLVAPHVALFYSLPSIGLLPLSIVWLGFGFPSQFVICLVFAFFPLYYAAFEGVATADRGLVRVAKSFGASDRQIFRSIVLPGSVPVLLYGTRVAAVMTIRGVVLVELIASTAGVGYRLQVFGDYFQTANIFGLILVICAVGLAIDTILRVVERRIDRWRPSAPGQLMPVPTKRSTA